MSLVAALGCDSPHPQTPAADIKPTLQLKHDTSRASEAAGQPSAGVHKAFTALRITLLKRRAAQAAAISNTRGYELSVQRHRRQREATGMDSHILSGPLDEAAFHRAWASLAEEFGLLILATKIGVAIAPSVTPRVHRAKGPYRYNASQLFRKIPVTLTFSSAPAQVQVAMYRRQIGLLDLPLFIVDEVVETNRGVRWHGHLLEEHALLAPLHTPAEVTLESIAEGADLVLAEQHPRFGELQKMAAEIRSLRADLRPALEALGQGHLATARFRVYSELTKRLSKQPLPGLGAHPTPHPAGHHGHGQHKGATPQETP